MTNDENDKSDVWEYVGMPLLSVVNRHAVSCGKPPHFRGGDSSDGFISYFENDYGEQLVFTYSYVYNSTAPETKKKGFLYHGDTDWEEPYEIIDGVYPFISLSIPEQLWLDACWMVCTKTGTPEQWDAFTKRRKAKVKRKRQALDKKLKKQFPTAYK